MIAGYASFLCGVFFSTLVFSSADNIQSFANAFSSLALSCSEEKIDYYFFYDSLDSDYSEPKKLEKETEEQLRKIREKKGQEQYQQMLICNMNKKIQDVYSMQRRPVVNRSHYGWLKAYQDAAGFYRDVIQREVQGDDIKKIKEKLEKLKMNGRERMIAFFESSQRPSCFKKNQVEDWLSVLVWFFGDEKYDIFKEAVKKIDSAFVFEFVELIPKDYACFLLGYFMPMMRSFEYLPSDDYDRLSLCVKAFEMKYNISMDEIALARRFDSKLFKSHDVEMIKSNSIDLFVTLFYKARRAKELKAVMKSHGFQSMSGFMVLKRWLDLLPPLYRMAAAITDLGGGQYSDIYPAESYLMLTFYMRALKRKIDIDYNGILDADTSIIPPMSFDIVDLLKEIVSIDTNVEELKAIQTKGVDTIVTKYGLVEKDEQYLRVIVNYLCNDQYLDDDFIGAYPNSIWKNLHPGVLWLLGKAFENKCESLQALEAYKLSAQMGFTSLYEDVARLETNNAKRIEAIKKATAYAEKVGYRSRVKQLKALLKLERASQNKVEPDRDVEYFEKDTSISDEQLAEDFIKYARTDPIPETRGADCASFTRKRLSNFYLKINRLFYQPDIMLAHELMGTIHQTYDDINHSFITMASKPSLKAAVISQEVLRLRSLALMMNSGGLAVNNPEALNPLLVKLRLDQPIEKLSNPDDHMGGEQLTTKILQAALELVYETLDILYPGLAGRARCYCSQSNGSGKITLRDPFALDEFLSSVLESLLAQAVLLTSDLSKLNSSAPTSGENSANAYGNSQKVQSRMSARTGGETKKARKKSKK